MSCAVIQNACIYGNFCYVWYHKICLYISGICPRSFVNFYLVTYYIKTNDVTSWTNSTSIEFGFMEVSYSKISISLCIVFLVMFLYISMWEVPRTFNFINKNVLFYFVYSSHAFFCIENTSAWDYWRYYNRQNYIHI